MHPTTYLGALSKRNMLNFTNKQLKMYKKLYFSYLFQNSKYDAAEQDDLWQYLTEQAHRDGTLPNDLTVKIIMDTWTLQMGFPVVNVHRNYNDNSATVSQERFLISKSENNPDKHNYMW